ncbi:MAG: serine hydroxymethyltransferase [Chloroflexi bacterium]|nr:serine hydroxymethyltransferase [Chloroflexota bacterium]MYF79603.1 serine hydroxymethyltransferase [Chloroflexota bacterium]MYK61772.1 serine hydroxymethyltransferase [Chloroflexota bacterium]
MNLQSKDPRIAEIIAAEERRLREEIVLIASENYASRAVLEATGSVLTNKYAEGYPGRRYYAGTENVDAAESLAIDRAKQLFQGAEHANVQPHSGSQANMAAYFAALEPGDRVMGMSLDHGGHLTHGSPVNFSGRIYDFVHYGLDEESEMIDYDVVERIANELKPKIIVSGYSAYSRTIDFERFGQIADSIGALHLADMAHIAGLVATGAHPSPVPHADIVTSTTHKTLRGPRGAMALTTKAWARKYDSAVFPRMQGGPMGHTIAAKAVAYKEALSDGFKTYADNIVSNATALANALSSSGMRIVSDGTDNHLMLVDLRGLNVSGAEAEVKMRSVGIVANKNMVPFDPNPPRVTSGVRVGVPAVTSRGMGTEDMETIAELIVESLRVQEDSTQQRALAQRLKEFAEGFAVPGIDS